MKTTRQTPIGSGFDARSTASDVLRGIDLTGRNAIVTGGYSGIGIEMVRALLAAGAHVTVPARRVAAAREAFADFSEEVEVQSMDLADISSVRDFADQYLAGGRDLHILINNAGIMACPEARIGPGWERQLGVNHLGHMALALSLLPALKAASAARVVALSSTAHIISDIHWDDPHFEVHPYDKWQAYGQAKTANALFALAADRSWDEYGISAFSVHPGGIFTPLQRHLEEEELVALGWKAPDGTVPDHIQRLFKTPEQGAATAVWAATSPQLESRGGEYCENCDIAPLADGSSGRHEHARSWITDEAKARQLWEMSLEMLAAA